MVVRKIGRLLPGSSLARSQETINCPIAFSFPYSHLTARLKDTALCKIYFGRLKFCYLGSHASTNKNTVLSVNLPQLNPKKHTPGQRFNMIRRHANHEEACSSTTEAPNSSPLHT